MNGLLQDLRYAIRQVKRAPGFAVVAVITLALGIGANTAIFSVVNGVLLRPLAFKDPDRLVRVWHVPPQTSFPGITKFSVSPANFLDWQAQNHAFERMAIYGFRIFTLTGSEQAEQVVRFQRGSLIRSASGLFSDGHSQLKKTSLDARVLLS